MASGSGAAQSAAREQAGKDTCQCPWKKLQLQRPWLLWVRPSLPTAWGSQSSPFLPPPQWLASASHHNEEGWEEAKPHLCPSQGMCSLSWDSKLRQSWACGELGEKTREGFLLSFILAFVSHSKNVIFYLIRVLKLAHIWESRKQEE